MATQNIKEKRLSSNLLNRKIIKPCGGLAKTKHKRSKAEISEYKSVEQRLAKLNECLLSFGPNPDENINLLVALCGEQLGATCALYNRLKDGMLYSVGQWNTPPDFTSKDKPDGHICYDLIQSGQDEVRVIRNLPKTTYAQTDPNVMCYGLKTYVGIPVSFESALIGSLCVVYQEDYVPSEDDKKFLGITTSAIGVEEKRKEAEEVLQRQREELQIILNSVPASILYKDKENRFIRVNKTCAELLGRPKEEIEGKSCFEIFPPDQGEAFWRDDKEVMASGRSKRNIIEPVETPEGTKWVQTDKIPYRNEKGNIIGVIGFAIDITERKQAEEALRQSEERYRTLVEESFNGIFIQKGPKIIFANQHLYEMLRYDKGELEGMDHWLVYHPDYQELTRERAQVRMQGENVPSQYEVKLQRKDGSSFDGEINARKIMFGSEPGIQVWVRDITERKQAEKKLRESEEKYRTILENIEEGYYEVDIAGNFTFFNDSLCRMLGYTKDELMGMNNRQYTDQENAKKLYQAFNKVYKTREPEKGFDWEVIRKDGTMRFVEASVSLIKDYRGQPIGFRGIVRDITEHKQAEEVLRESERTTKRLAQENAIVAEIGRIISSTLNIEEVYERFAEEARRLIPFDRIVINLSNLKNNNSITAYVAGIDVQGRRAGDVFSLAGSTHEHIIRTRSSLLIQTEDEAEVAGRFPALLSTFRAGMRSMMSVPLISKDEVIGVLHFRSLKAKAYSELNIRLAENIGNQIAGAIANAQLFVERKRAEEALRKSEERFRDLYDNAPVGYHELDTEGRIIRVNRRELEMFGYSAEEMLGKPVWKFILEEEASRQSVMSKIAGLKPFEKGFERIFRRKDGTTFPVLMEEKCLKDSEGRIVGIRSIQQDITERKRTEEEMVSLQEQLRQSQKIEAVGQLAGGIAHDFNNLLTVIKGYSQLSLLDLKESDPLWENIQEIQKATQRATDLTRQLLAFSRRQILDLKVLDLNTLLQDLNKMLHRILGEDIELTTLLAEDLERVKIDPGQIEQAVMNLAVNARDAMPMGGKLTIEIANVELDEEYARAHIAVTPGRYVKLSVSDTGSGMSKEVKEKVFEPFFTTKEKGKGTGLGLSTVYGIVKQIGGNIWVYSEPGHGTTFKIYIPRVEEALDALHLRDDTDSLPRGSETILLVEDEPSVRSLAYRLLCQQGYTVLEATNGKEALRVVQEHAGENIHLLLTDVVMPQIGGKELADRLKILQPDIKVLFISGYTDNAIVHHGVLEPGINFLQKPFSPTALSRKVREALDK